MTGTRCLIHCRVPTTHNNNIIPRPPLYYLRRNNNAFGVRALMSNVFIHFVSHASPAAYRGTIGHADNP